jgi:hypothetical protein
LYAHSAQTASELAIKYAHHVVYEVQPGVQMKAKFASNGSVCEMRIEQEHFLQNQVDMTYGIDKDRITRLVDQVVPTSEVSVRRNTCLVSDARKRPEWTALTSATVHFSVQMVTLDQVR